MNDKILTIDNVDFFSYFELISFLGDLSLHFGGISNTAHCILKANIKTNDHILEIGCGTGKTTLVLSNCGLQISVIEPSSYLLDAMLFRYKNLRKPPPIYYNIFAEDMRDIDGNDLYDAILLECTFGFIYNKLAVIPEIYRLLKPYGKLIITDFFYKQDPPQSIKDNLLKILNIHEILLKKNWLNYFSQDYFSEYFFEELSNIQNNISLKMVCDLMYMNKYSDKYIYSDLLCELVYKRLYEWNIFFEKNKKFMIPFNCILIKC